MAKRPNPLQPLLERLPKPLRNKYFLTLSLFLGWMVFFDNHDLLTQIRLQRTVNRMHEDKAMYEQRIEAAKQDRLDLEVNKEKFAREQYYMKKSGEEVFIIEEEED
ncbi:hypothetical protein [Phaeodactylibacter luteus]|uniref:Septum formation initiator family protein n=1 Tax=Phaeodactylibacter luteus TaxID=1564516 RepID=A0A5C6RU07_9BACT|nr:hypothetical protein [Phaeodactylibacter luteus]TXB65587.1 hypothetical protein FRY97_06290 [Phaeodactylibacter luteus]